VSCLMRILFSLWKGLSQRAITDVRYGGALTIICSCCVRQQRVGFRRSASHYGSTP
jgi:hypothetical protein